MQRISVQSFRRFLFNCSKDLIAIVSPCNFPETERSFVWNRSPPGQSFFAQFLSRRVPAHLSVGGGSISEQQTQSHHCCLVKQLKVFSPSSCTTRPDQICCSGCSSMKKFQFFGGSAILRMIWPQLLLATKFNISWRNKMKRWTERQISPKCNVPAENASLCSVLNLRFIFWYFPVCTFCGMHKRTDAGTSTMAQMHKRKSASKHHCVLRGEIGTKTHMFWTLRGGGQSYK